MYIYLDIVINVLCSLTIFSNWADSKPSVLPIYKKLIGAGLRIWVYRYFSYMFCCTPFIQCKYMNIT